MKGNYIERGSIIIKKIGDFQSGIHKGSFPQCSLVNGNRYEEIDSPLYIAVKSQIICVMDVNDEEKESILSAL